MNTFVSREEMYMNVVLVSLSDNSFYQHIVNHAFHCVCISWCSKPVELIDVFYISKQGTHLFWPNGKVTHINNVSQVVLEESRERVMHKRKCQHLF